MDMAHSVKLKKNELKQRFADDHIKLLFLFYKTSLLELGLHSLTTATGREI